jgi:uncharacterized protein (TIGR03000 family)
MRHLILGAAAVGLTLVIGASADAQFGRRGGFGFGVNTGNSSFGYGQPYYGWYGGRGVYSPGWYNSYYGPNWYGRSFYEPNWYGRSFYYGPSYGAWTSYPNYQWSGVTYSQPTGFETNSYASVDNPAGQTSYYSGTGGHQANQAILRVVVPDAAAQVMIEDKPTTQRGTQRTFVSPPLEAGKEYSYTVRATWMENGQQLEREKTVPVKPGEQVTVNFMDRGQAITDDRLQPQDRQYQDSERRPLPDAERGAIPRNEQRPVPDTDRPLPRTERQPTGDTAAAITGRVVRLDGNELVIADSSGTERTFRLATDGSVMMNGAKAEIGQLRPDMRVSLTPQAGSQNVISRIEVRDRAADR